MGMCHQGFHWCVDGTLSTCFNALDRHVHTGRGLPLSEVARRDSCSTIKTEISHYPFSSSLNRRNEISVISIRKITGATAVIALASFGTLLGVTTAHAAAPLTSVQVTDGSTTGDEVTFDAGSNVTLVLNGAQSGDFEFTGCYAVFADDTMVQGNTTVQPFTWTAGASVTTVFPMIDLSPTATTVYDIKVYEQTGSETACANVESSGDFYRFSWVTMYIEVPSPAVTMTLTGNAMIGSTVLVESIVPGSLIGGDFDLWACPNQDLLPRDDQDDELNGDCVGPFIQSRTGDSTTFLLGFDPVRDAGNEEAAQDFWASICGKYFVINDYPGGGHSNWIGPVNCSPSATDNAELAQTGSSSALVLGVAASSLVIAVLMVVMSRRARRSRLTM